MSSTFILEFQETSKTAATPKLANGTMTKGGGDGRRTTDEDIHSSNRAIPVQNAGTQTLLEDRRGSDNDQHDGDYSALGYVE